MNLLTHIVEWLESVGADGLISLMDESLFWDKGQIEDAAGSTYLTWLVPAYRHADGSYHTEPEWAPIECTDCEIGSQRSCANRNNCKYWLTHKEKSK